MTYSKHHFIQENVCTCKNLADDHLEAAHFNNFNYHNKNSLFSAIVCVHE